jgi:hypothetical protein
MLEKDHERNTCGMRSALRHEVILASELAESLILQADSVVTESIPPVRSFSSTQPRLDSPWFKNPQDGVLFSCLPVF